MASKLFRAVPLLSSLATVFASVPALAATWQEAVNYGGSTNMNLYVPDTLDPSPGIVVALHSCGNEYESDSRNYVQTSADEYGFIIIQLRTVTLTAGRRMRVKTATSPTSWRWSTTF
jgi:poly(3-hydroxybutyrate) depolymerase